MLDVQKYPDLRQYPGGPPERPYDAAGWTLPLQMGVRVVAAATPLSAETQSKIKTLGPAVDPKLRPAPYLSGRDDSAPFDSVPGVGFNSNAVAVAIVPPPGRITGAGSSIAVDPAENNAFRAINRAWHEGGAVQFAAATAARTARYIITGLSEERQTELVRALALAGERTNEMGVSIPKPRIGLYEPWGGNMSAGWTRWILDQYGFDYATLRSGDFHAPLTGRIDVVVMPDGARLGAATSGRRARAVRPEYADTVSTDDLASFETFIRAGGTLVCLSSSGAFAIQQFKLPVTNSVGGLRPEEFFLRGSLVATSVDLSHPIMAGMPGQAAVFVDGSPVFDVGQGFSGTVLARYADSGSPLLSGYLIGEKYLAGKAAALDVPLDSGHVILLGFRPEWRGQPFGTFRVLFNALLNMH